MMRALNLHHFEHEESSRLLGSLLGATVTPEALLLHAVRASDARGVLSSVRQPPRPLMTLDSYAQQALLPQHAPDAPRELHVLHHDRDSFGVNSAQVRVLEQPDEVSLGRFL